MLTSPRVNLVESDSGFSVEVLGRTGIKYREGAKVLFVDSEVLVTGKGIMVVAKSIEHWDPPDDAELIGPEKKAIILNNIKDAIGFWNEPVEIV
jgi:hypothetical protein